MSFAPVIIFGGGPNFSTLEVSIYQALLYEYDFNKAINLALIQIIICAAKLDLIGIEMRFWKYLICR